MRSESELGVNFEMYMEKWIVSIYGNGTIFGKGNWGASES